MGKMLTLTSVLILHTIFLFGFDNLESLTKKNYSKNRGLSQIKIIVRVDNSHTPKTSESSGPEKKEKKRKLDPNKTTIPDAGKVVSQGQDELLAKYLTEIRAKILKYNYRSRLAKKLNLKGQVGIRFVIRFPNTIEELQITSSSGYEALDNSALETISAIDELPKLPEKLEINTLPITTSILYQ
jgi:TonB family protein